MTIAVVLLLFCILGLMGARAVASIAMMLFGLNALLGISPGEWLKNRHWLLGCAWVLLYIISGMWSEDKAEWWRHIQEKGPIVLLPICFASLPRPSRSHQLLYTGGLCALLLCGIGWSVSTVGGSWDTIVKEYRFSHLLPSPMYRNHIAFSSFVALAVLWLVQLWPALARRWMRATVAAAGAIFVAYLHVLASRTGLICLYLFGVLLWGRMLFQRKFLRAGLLAICCIGFLLAAVKYIPTLRHRWDYMKWTYEDFQRGYRGGIYSDLGRLISYDVGSRVIAAHPLGGVGAGDMLTAMQQAYPAHYPEVAPENRLLPHNQFLIAALAAGVLCGLLCLVWALVPVCRAPRSRDGFFLRAAAVLLLVPLLTDTFLEVQMGVGVYILTLGWHSLLARSYSDRQNV